MTSTILYLSILWCWALWAGTIYKTLDIPRSYITLQCQCAKHNNYNHKTSLSPCTHVRQPICRPQRPAIWCLSWVVQRNMTMIYREHTVYTTVSHSVIKAFTRAVGLYCVFPTVWMITAVENILLNWNVCPDLLFQDNVYVRNIFRKKVMKNIWNFIFH